MNKLLIVIISILAGYGLYLYDLPIIEYSGTIAIGFLVGSLSFYFANSSLYTTYARLEEQYKALIGEANRNLQNLIELQKAFEKQERAEKLLREDNQSQKEEIQHLNDLIVKMQRDKKRRAK